MSKRGRVSGGGETAEDRIRLIMNDRDKRISELEAQVANLRSLVGRCAVTGRAPSLTDLAEALAGKEK